MNTLPGYTPPDADMLTDSYDPGLGYQAGHTVRIAEDADVRQGQEGVVWAICRSPARKGALVVDVLFPGDAGPTRMLPDEIAEVFDM